MASATRMSPPGRSIPERTKVPGTSVVCGLSTGSEGIEFRVPGTGAGRGASLDAAAGDAGEPR
eukprot:5990361-Pyramimonas_sp.AAC.1